MGQTKQAAAEWYQRKKKEPGFLEKRREAAKAYRKAEKWKNLESRCVALEALCINLAREIEQLKKGLPHGRTNRPH